MRQGDQRLPEGKASVIGWQGLMMQHPVALKLRHTGRQQDLVLKASSGQGNRSRLSSVDQGARLTAEQLCNAGVEPRCDARSRLSCL